MNAINRTFKSTNFTLQSLIPLVTAALLLIGVPEEMSEEIITFVIATISAAVGFWGVLRDALKDVTFTWSSNVLTYIVAFFSGLFPLLADFDIAPAVDEFISAIASGDFSKIFAALFVVGNIIYQIVKANKDKN